MRMTSVWSCFCVSIILVLFPFGGNLFAKSEKAIALEARVHALNNSLEFDMAQWEIQQFLNSDSLTDDDRYEAYINLSFIHKRLFDYDAVLRYLDIALEFGQKTIKRDFYSSNVMCQKALAYFDIHEYDRADSIMVSLAKENYNNLDEEYQAKIFMQEAYLHFLKQQYAAADQRYDLAIEKLDRSSPCDLPMIYGKKIQLYGAMRKFKEMNHAFEQSILKANECGIVKYKMYSLEMMAKSFDAAGEYETALFYYKTHDSIKEHYNADAHLHQITELEQKYELTKKDQDVAKANEKIKQIEFRNLSLLSILGFSILIFGLAFMGYRHSNLLKSKKANLAYNRQLFEKIEIERSRIANDLHDSVGSDLLLLRNADPAEIGQKIEDVLNAIRHISRNLQPVLFQDLGLQRSLQSLIERLQARHGIVFLLEISYQNQLKPEAELQLFRILQEAISNIVKYSEAIAAKIRIVANQNFILVEVLDSGKGFNAKQALESGKAFGLHSIIQRTQAMGGVAKIQSEPNKTMIEIKLPI